MRITAFFMLSAMLVACKTRPAKLSSETRSNHETQVFIEEGGKSGTIQLALSEGIVETGALEQLSLGQIDRAAAVGLEPFIFNPEGKPMSLGLNPRLDASRCFAAQIERMIRFSGSASTVFLARVDPSTNRNIGVLGDIVGTFEVCPNRLRFAGDDDFRKFYDRLAERRFKRRELGLTIDTTSAAQVVTPKISPLLNQSIAKPKSSPKPSPSSGTTKILQDRFRKRIAERKQVHDAIKTARSDFAQDLQSRAYQEPMKKLRFMRSAKRLSPEGHKIELDLFDNMRKSANLKEIKELGQGRFASVTMVDHSGEVRAVRTEAVENRVRENFYQQRLNYLVMNLFAASSSKSNAHSQARHLRTDFSVVRHDRFITTMELKSGGELQGLLDELEVLKGKNLSRDSSDRDIVDALRKYYEPDDEDDVIVKYARETFNRIRRIDSQIVDQVLDWNRGIPFELEGNTYSLRFMHRDLKPQNIVLDADGNATIADFGFSKIILVSNDTQPRYFELTADPTTGKLKIIDLIIEGIKGTPPYFAPELLKKILASEENLAGKEAHDLLKENQMTGLQWVRYQMEKGIADVTDEIETEFNIAFNSGEEVISMLAEGSGSGNFVRNTPPRQLSDIINLSPSSSPSSTPSGSPRTTP